MNHKTDEQFLLYEKIVDAWFDIGVRIGIAPERLTSNNGDENMLLKLLLTWFDNAVRLPNSKDYPLSWEGLKTLLQDVGKGQVVEDYFKFLDGMP